MSSILLLCILVAILVATYRHFGCQVIHPAVLYTAFFVLAVACGLLNYQRYHFELHWVTVWVIAGGSALFSLVCAASESLARVVPRRLAHLSEPDGTPDEKGCLRIPATAYLLAVVLTCLAFVLLGMHIIDTSVAHDGPSDLLGAIAYNDRLSKFEGVDISIRGWLGHYLAITYAFYYLCAYVFAHNLMASTREVEWPAAAIMVAHLGLALLSGARQGLIQRLVCFTVMLVLFLERKVANGEVDGPRVHRHLAMISAACVMVGMLSFEPLLQLVGRGGALRGWEYISIYLGAPVKNLDMYLSGTLTEPITVTSQAWGEQTFASVYTSLSHWMGKDGAVDWLKWQPYQSINGVSLGNVYTTYYPFIFDWGVAGSMLAVAILAGVSEWTYLTAASSMRWRHSAIKTSVIAYGILAYGLIFSFFLNFAVTSTVNTGFARMMLVCIAASFLLAWGKGTRTKQGDKAHT